MEAIKTSSSGQVTQPTVKTTDSKQEKQSQELKTEQNSVDDFSAYLSKSLGRSGQQEVSEEELFSALLSQRLAEKSPEAATFYDSKVAEFSGSMARADGYVPVEDVAKEALRATVSSGKVTEQEAEIINAEAFAAAQLDSNAESLFDNRGDTKAVASMEEAMFKVKSVLEAVEAGSLTLPARSLDIPSNIGHTTGAMIALGLGSGGLDRMSESGELIPAGGMSEKQVRFTWKHIASDGNLAILLPTRLNGNIKGVSLFDSEGNLLEKGDYSKQTGDQRAVYRFNEPGGHYGKNVDAVVYLKDGSTLTYRVKNGNERTYVPQDDFKKRSLSELESDLLGNQPNPVIIEPGINDGGEIVDGGDPTEGGDSGSEPVQDSPSPDSGSGNLDQQAAL